jgi:hypothetical protein
VACDPMRGEREDYPPRSPRALSDCLEESKLYSKAKSLTETRESRNACGVKKQLLSPEVVPNDGFAG